MKIFIAILAAFVGIKLYEQSRANSGTPTVLATGVTPVPALAPANTIFPSSLGVSGGVMTIAPPQPAPTTTGLSRPSRPARPVPSEVTLPSSLGLSSGATPAGISTPPATQLIPPDAIGIDVPPLYPQDFVITRPVRTMSLRGLQVPTDGAVVAGEGSATAASPVGLSTFEV